ncbi:hypothetical protein SLS58_004916 [Diplodia intermedia]|uniref:DUF7708 domain-containing protein n=1 Tax=Diplodia intermedia TaxID=856260 RepID=A0ABR3TSR0_9PEZI
MATTSSAPAPPSPAPSRQARLTIKEAFTRLSQSITPDDARRFQSTTLKDVRQAAVEVEDKLATSQSLRNMRRVESLLNGIEHYSKVLEVLCNGTPYLPWIWLSSEYLSSFEKLIDAYAQIAETIPRFDRLSAAFQNEAGFQELLAMFYADILDFHRRAYKFFPWQRFFDSSWEVVPYIIDNHASKSMTSSTKDLRTLLPHILSNTPSGRIILDGLDECDTEEQKLILKNTLDVMRSTGSGWKMLISSQEIPTITRGLSNLSQKNKLSLSEENQSINSAIGTFIDRRIAMLQTDAPYLWHGDGVAASSLKEKLNRKSNGLHR